MRAAVALALLVACTGGVDVGQTTQPLSACLDGDGRNLTCTTGGSGTQCGAGGSECYCPEAQPSELAYCNTRSNCTRPEYASHCKGGCGGTPTFVHWCVSGQMP